MEALILAGGRGARLDALLDAGGGRNKCMLRVGGVPLIEYSLASAARAGARAIVVVVGRSGEEIVRHFGDDFAGIPVRYVLQLHPRGVVDAMEHGRRLLRDPDVLLCLGDEILDAPRHPSMLRRFHDARLFASCGVVSVADRRTISKTYSLIADGDLDHGRIQRLVEKPRVALNDWMGTGNCLLRLGIFDYIPRTPVNPVRGEKELPDLIQCAIDERRRVEYFRIADSYVNVNNVEDVLAARARLASRARPLPVARPLRSMQGADI